MIVTFQQNECMCTIFDSGHFTKTVQFSCLFLAHCIPTPHHIIAAKEADNNDVWQKNDEGCKTHLFCLLSVAKMCHLVGTERNSEQAICAFNVVCVYDSCSLE